MKKLLLILALIPACQPAVEYTEGEPVCNSGTPEAGADITLCSDVMQAVSTNPVIVDCDRPSPRPTVKQVGINMLCEQGQSPNVWCCLWQRPNGT